MRKFDFVIGNPAYQDERQGDSTTALPIYHKFMSAAYEVGKASELITPARFLFNAGRTPKQWNEERLNDRHFKVLSFEQDGSKVFPNTDIKGGVAITYRDENKSFAPVGTFTLFPQLNSILQKTIPFSSQKSIAGIAFVASKFNTANLFHDYPEYTGHERRMSSNVLDFKCFTDKPQQEDDIAIYGIYGKSRTSRYLHKTYVDLSDKPIMQYKIVTPKADGNGTFGDTLTSPEILKPCYGFTHTFLGIGGFETNEEATAALKYLKSKFARALLGVLKVTQDLNADKWKYVPMQDFTSNSDITWNTTIANIDRQLYKKYGLSQEEIDFIETHVKEMT